jgi:hypothetical protein
VYPQIAARIGAVFGALVVEIIYPSLYPCKSRINTAEQTVSSAELLVPDSVILGYFSQINN